MNAIIIFCFLAFLLICGKFLRMSIPLLQRLYLPSSVIGGAVGLILINVFKNSIPPEIISGVKSLPGFLINVVFAALFLGANTPGIKRIWNLTLPQLCFGQIVSWGQYVIGLSLCGFLLIPLFNVSPAFGNLLEIGFEGGHGTVGGMAKSFEAYHWADGIALGYTIATIGMIFGIVLGMALINWAAGRNYIGNIRSFSQQNNLERAGVYHPFSQPSAGKQTVFCDSIDSLAWHVSLIGVSILIGYLLLLGLQQLEIICFNSFDGKRLFSAFPLFPLCMIGGVIVQKFARMTRSATLINREQMQRLSGASLDFLVVSAVATIQISVVMNNWKPLLILIICGTLWSILPVIFLAKHLFKEAWFERAIADFGQSMGVTATGLLLLRTVDPENKTIAAEAFGYKQLLHEPFMGGGLWTALALTLVFNWGYLPVLLISIGALLFWLIVAFFICRAK